MHTKLKPTEKLKDIFRQHWIILWKPIILFVCVVILIGLLTINLEHSSNAYIPYLLIILILTSLYLGIKIIQRHSRLWIVTSQRVIYEWGVISINIKESSIEKINSTSFHKSLLGRILNYGDILIETAAEKGDIKFEKIADPQRFTDRISEGKESGRFH